MKPNCDEPLTQAVDRPKRGTKVVLHLRDDAVEFLNSTHKDDSLFKGVPESVSNCKSSASMTFNL